MALRRRARQRQQSLWIASDDLEAAPRNRFYEALNRLLAEGDFDRVSEDACAPYYQSEHTPGRPSIPPSVYFRMLFVGYFEGIESERGICWRCADSLSLRAFLGLSLRERVPDHSSLSRIRSRLPVSVFATVFELVLDIVAKHGLLSGRVMGIDSTFMRADASMKAIVRRDTGEGYREFITRLAAEDAGRAVSAEEARAFDRTRPKRTSNREWVSGTDADARIARLKDGRTRLAYKTEHVLDLETQALLSARILPADAGDGETLVGGVAAANAQLARIRANANVDAITAASPAGSEIVADAAAGRESITGGAPVADAIDAASSERDPVAAPDTTSTLASPEAPAADEDDPPPDAPGGGTTPRAPAGDPSTLENEGDAPALESAVNDQRVVADKGYHKARCIRDLKEAGYRTVIPERAHRGTRRWRDKGGRATAVAVYQNAWRTQRALGKRWLRKRGEVVERSFAHTLDTGASRRTRLRGLENVQKRYSITAAAANLGLVLRTLLGYGTPRGLYDRVRCDDAAFNRPTNPAHRPTRAIRPLAILHALHHRLLSLAPAWPQQHHGLLTTTC